MKKPDVFEKMIDRVIESDGSVDLTDGFVSRREALTVLRAHHRKVVRMVQKQADISCPHDGPHADDAGCVAYRQACDDILAKLKAMEGKK